MRMLQYINIACMAMSPTIAKLINSNLKRAAHFRSNLILRSTATTDSDKSTTTMPRNFITNLIEEDLRTNKNGPRVVTRFPPEPNGYLHLGHAKSICLNFGVSQIYNGKTNMRFDDTNPEKENMEYINSIIKDVKWLVNDDSGEVPWDGEIRHASDYFESIYQAAVFLIKEGLAYVDSLSQGNT